MTSVSFPRYKQFYSELNTKQLFQPVIRELPANQAPRFFRDDPETEKTLFTSFQGTPSSRFSFQLTFTFNDPRTILSLLLRPWQTRTHCCGHIVADTNVSPFARARNICCGHKFCVRDTKNVSDFVQKHFVSATNVSQFAQPRKQHGQQCVRNNESSFTRALRT